MTVQDIIRKLHKDGKMVNTYDLFIGNIFDLEESIAESEDKDSFVKVIYDCEIPPLYVEVGNHPEYIYFATREEYIRKRLTKKVPDHFPRLCIGVERNASYLLNKDWKGHMWSEIPPIELAWVGSDLGDIPEIDIEGRFTRTRGQAYPLADIDEPNFYYLKDKNGVMWAWLGNPMKDKIPEGLTLFNAKAESGGRI